MNIIERIFRYSLWLPCICYWLAMLKEFVPDTAYARELAVKYHMPYWAHYMMQALWPWGVIISGVCALAYWSVVKSNKNGQILIAVVCFLFIIFWTTFSMGLNQGRMEWDFFSLFWIGYAVCVIIFLNFSVLLKIFNKKEQPEVTRSGIAGESPARQELSEKLIQRKKEPTYFEQATQIFTFIPLVPALALMIFIFFQAIAEYKGPYIYIIILVTVFCVTYLTQKGMKFRQKGYEKLAELQPFFKHYEMLQEKLKALRDQSSAMTDQILSGQASGWTEMEYAQHSARQAEIDEKISSLDAQITEIEYKTQGYLNCPERFKKTS